MIYLVEKNRIGKVGIRRAKKTVETNKSCTERWSRKIVFLTGIN